MLGLTTLKRQFSNGPRLLPVVLVLLFGIVLSAGVALASVPPERKEAIPSPGTGPNVTPVSGIMTDRSLSYGKGVGSPDCWIATPNPFKDGHLNDVDELPSSEMWAVGAINVSGFDAGLVGRRHDEAWSRAYVGSEPGELQAVGVLSDTDVWAVGALGSSPGTAWALRWDGGAWSSVAVPTPASESSILYDIAVLSTGDAWAVGEYVVGYTTYPLIERWDGLAWTVWAVQEAGALRGIYALAPDDIWAVGDQGLPSPLVMHWDGAAWSNSPAPSVGLGSGLASVSGTSSSDVWAVGSATIQTGDSATLIIHWDGTGWTTVTVPVTSSPQIYFSWLSSVVAISPTDAWAVGGKAYSVFRLPIILRWDGASWSSASVEQLGMANLEGVDAISSTEAWVVGRSFALGWNGAFTARYQEGACPTATATATPTPCALTFADVQPDHTFYPFVYCLACRGIVDGYPCGGQGEPCNGYNDPYFRPNRVVTRGQLAKIVSNAAGYADPQFRQLFQDVPADSTFFQYIGRLVTRGYMSGYPCGGAGKPCVPPDNLPYFRPNAPATRGQLAKIVSNTAGYYDSFPPEEQSFTDVPSNSPFWVYVERVYWNRPGLLVGYPCGGVGEPCAPLHLPYFRPQNDVTRGQTSKMVAGVFFPSCRYGSPELP